MVAAFTAFFWQPSSHAWWFLTNVILVKKPIWELLAPKRRAKLKKRFKRLAAVTIPPWATYLFAVSGILIATFLAVKDEHDDQIRAQTELTTIKDRSAVIAKLGVFYTKADLLANGGGLDHNSSKADYDKYVAHISDWINETRSWIENNIGKGEASTFMDYERQYKKGAIHHGIAISADHDWQINYVGDLRENLHELIESELCKVR
jgi:hypothetical protein